MKILITVFGVIHIFVALSLIRWVHVFIQALSELGGAEPTTVKDILFIILIAIHPFLAITGIIGHFKNRKKRELKKLTIFLIMSTICPIILISILFYSIGNLDSA